LQYQEREIELLLKTQRKKKTDKTISGEECFGEEKHSAILDIAKNRKTKCIK